MRCSARVFSVSLCLGVSLALTVGFSTAASASPKVTERYDNAFRKSSRRFFGAGFDGRVFKAQAMAEGVLAPTATSRVGARGVMQLLPSTYASVRSSNPELGAIDDPDCNIAAGIFHDRQLWNGWASASDERHRDRFTFGSYNAGLMTLVRAQRIARDRLLDERIWPSIEAVAPAVPRWRYSETFNYLSRIRTNLALMDADGRIK